MLYSLNKEESTIAALPSETNSNSSFDLGESFFTALGEQVIFTTEGPERQILRNRRTDRWRSRVACLAQGGSHRKLAKSGVLKGTIHGVQL